MSQKTYEELQKEIEQLKKDNKQKDIQIENLQLHINTLNRYIFGSRREQIKKDNEHLVEGVQCSVFGVPEDEELQKQIEEKTEEITVYKKKNVKKQSSGIKKAILKNIECETIVVNLEENQKCPECGSSLKKIGQEPVREEIEYIPAKLKLKIYVRETYMCEECGKESNEKDTATIIHTKTPAPLLSRSFASPSLAAEVIYQKYYMGAPLYRQEKMWDDLGLVLPRNMMANWCIKISQYYLEPLYELMLKKLKAESEVLHIDETTMQCNKETGKKASSNSYMWVLASGENEEKRGVIFKYSKSRSGEIAQEILKDYENILVTDGYAGYNNLENVKRAECWAHARRYFYESIPLDENKQMVKTSDGYTGVCYIDELFKIENEIAEKNVTEKLKIRKEKSAQILNKFYDWVYLTSEKYIVNNKLKKAITYAINQKENLSKFIEDGRIPLTNSKAERAIRPFAVHRKNWLFADTVKGAKANAVYYSFIESAKVNNLNIYKYVNYLLSELPQLEGAQEEGNIEKYLPWSKELPKEILNFEGTYKELEFEE